MNNNTTVLGCLVFFLIVFFASCYQFPYHDGEVAYKKVCANCHMENGEGLPNLVPPLAGSDYMKNNYSILPCIIKNGLEGVITVNGKQYQEKMWGIEKINDIEITNILNYVNNSWGNNYGVYRLDEVQKIIKSCQ